MPSDLVKTETDGLVRDTKTGALINTNVAELAIFKARRAQLTEGKKLLKRIERLERMIESQQAQIEELKAKL